MAMNLLIITQIVPTIENNQRCFMIANTALRTPSRPKIPR
jgi:hypothetical protein